MKMKIQAQHLQPGDIVGGTGERVQSVIVNSIHWKSNKVHVALERIADGAMRSSLWGKYTLINVERAEKPLLAIETREDGIS